MTEPESVAEVTPPAKVARCECIDFSRCIICQTHTVDELVERPVAHEKVLQFIKERASYGDGICPETWKRLANTTSQDLVTNSATWHRKCYQDTTHTGSNNITVNFIFCYSIDNQIA